MSNPPPNWEPTPGWGPPENQPPSGGNQPPPGFPPPGFPPPGSQPPGSQPGGYGGQPWEPSQASLALGLSIASSIVGIILCCCGGIGPFIGLGLAGAGIYISRAELAAIAEGRRSPSNEGNANTAKIIGIVGLVVCGLLALGVLFLWLLNGVSVSPANLQDF